jgi:hypothetical protein
MRRRCASGCEGIVDLNVEISPCPSAHAFASPMPASGKTARTATPAERVRLVVALSETGGTLRYIVVSLEVRGCGCGWAFGVLILATDCAGTVSNRLGTERSGGAYLVTLLLVSRVGVVAVSSCESEFDMSLARHNFERVWG